MRLVRISMHVARDDDASWDDATGAGNGRFDPPPNDRFVTAMSHDYRIADWRGGCP